MNPEAAVPRVPPVDRGGFPGERAWSPGSLLAPLRRAQDGAQPAQSTRVRVAHDGDVLFVRFDCEDLDAWSTHLRRDAPLWEEEVVEVFLAPGEADPAAYVEIEVNPGGAIFDARVVNPDSRRDTLELDTRWDAPGLTVRVTRPDPRVWRAEIALPWRDLDDGPLPPVWRANFFRIDRPRGAPPEFTCWSPTMTDPPDFHRPARFGRLILD